MEPHDAVPDQGTMHLDMPPEDAAPAPQDAVPPESGTVRLGRTGVPGQAAEPEAVPTVRLAAEPGTVRLGRAVPGQAPEPDVVATVRLTGEPDAIATVRLPAGSEPVGPTPTLIMPVEHQAAPAPAAAPAPTMHLSLGAAASAAEAAAAVPSMPSVPPAPAAPLATAAPAAAAAASAAEAAAGDPGLIRFGPGVPDPKTARTIAVWRGEVAPEPEAEEKKRRGWLFWVPVLLVFLALLGWWLHGLLAPASVKISATSVQVSPTSLSCDSKATITATVTTDGSGGSFRYRWLRSDGTDSGLLTETVAAGTHSVQLPLIWSLSGPGTFSGKATLEIEDRPALTQSASFSYSCNG